MFEASEGYQLLAGTVIFDFGQVVHNQYITNSPEGRKRGGLDYLIHTLIEKFFPIASILIFGISTEESGQYLNAALIQKKELIGGRGIIYNFYKISL